MAAVGERGSAVGRVAGLVDTGDGGGAGDGRTPDNALEPRLPGQPITLPSTWLRLVPVPLLIVSVLLGWLLTPALIQPDRMSLSLGPTAALLALRVVGEAFADRLRVRSPIVLAGFLLHAVVLLLAVALNPFVCIYAFFGYLDADRYLGQRLAPAAVVLTGLTCAFGQSGGFPGVTATPALFLVLSVVNVALALTMMRITVSREREVAAREQALDALAKAHQENLALHDQLLRQAHETGIGDERARLSRELHDTVAQGLVAVIRQLENLPADLDPAVRQRVERAEQAARECLTEARRAVRALGPWQLQDGDLPDAVRAVVESWALTNDIEARVRIDGTPTPGAGDEVLLRVVQEALSNVARHAGARSVTVTLSSLSDQLIVDVHDDGRGFDPASTAHGHGLDGMAERLTTVGGRLGLETAPGDGTTVVAAIPRGRP